MNEITLHIIGVAPLILHNARLSDPLDEWTMKVAEISGKRKKTVADLKEMARREWYGSMYLDTKGSPCVPGSNLERMLRDAAAKSKEGKTVQAGVIVPDDAPIIYDGPSDIDELWESGRFSLRASCKVGQQRVIRTRPCWERWELKFTALFDPDIVKSGTRIKDYAILAGRQIGLADWRPKHGRFEVQ